MKVAILGTRGVPNYYGGFEQFAEYFSAYLADKGHEVYVYNSHNHPYQEKMFKGAHIIHKHDPEYKMGTFWKGYNDGSGAGYLKTSAECNPEERQ